MHYLLEARSNQSLSSLAASIEAIALIEALAPIEALELLKKHEALFKLFKSF
jgi:hypothetical protein